MSEAFFAINDLARRKFHTILTIACLTLSVASTLFLLLFSNNVGIGITAATENRLTASLSNVFSQFLLFIEVLFVAVGAAVASFTAFLMTSQRSRDIGLMRAAGCPNELVFGYFMNELGIVTIVSCFLGVVVGLLANIVSVGLLSNAGFHVVNESVDFWLVIIVFLLFLGVSLLFGTKPILDATKVKPARALSPAFHLGLTNESSFRIVSKSGLVMKLALRSLSKRKSAAFRIVACLAAVFMLVTATVAGEIVAGQTSKSWIERAVGRNAIVIAHRDMVHQYKTLLSTFYETEDTVSFGYANESYRIPDRLVDSLSRAPKIASVETRLVLEAHVKEVKGYRIDPETLATISVGDSREGDAIVVGIDPAKTSGGWFLKGGFLKSENDAFEAVIGDSLAQRMFVAPLNQSIAIAGKDLDVVGVCLDSINNGKVTYVPLKILQNITQTTWANLVVVNLTGSGSRSETLAEMAAIAKAESIDLEVLDLGEILDKSMGYLGFLWSVILLMPISSMVTASLCLVGYVMLALAEQRQEFGILRALGAETRTITSIVAIQNSLVLFSGCAVGVAFGFMGTLLVLIPDPIVTAYTVLEVVGYLLATSTGMLLVSLCPAEAFARTSVRKLMD